MAESSSPRVKGLARTALAPSCWAECKTPMPTELPPPDIDHTEAEAGPLLDILGSEKWLEAMLDHLGTHAAPGIADRQQYNAQSPIVGYFT